MNNTTQEYSELYHHGILGMKWGVRRFQNKDGSLTTAGKKRYDSDGDESSGETKKKKFSLKKSGSKEDIKKTTSKEDESEQKKTPSKEEDTEAYEAAKQKALKSGSATEILKFKGDLTQQEMQSAISRIRWEQDMQSLSAKEVAAGKSKADELFDKMDKATKYAETGIKTWNTVANVYNALNTDGTTLPKISTNIANDNKQERKAEKKEKAKAEEAKKKREQQEAEGEAKRKERADKKAKEKEDKNDKDKGTKSDNTKTDKDTKTESNTSTSTKKETWKGEVEGDGTSFNKDADKSKPNDYYEPFDIDSDVDWVYEYGGNTSTSNMPSETVAIGKAKVEQFLLEKKGR